MGRDYEGEALLGDIIRCSGDVMSYLNLVEEELAHEDDGSGHRMPEEEGDHDDGSSNRVSEEEGDHDDGSGDRVPEEEGDHDDGSGDRTEGAVAKSSGEVYILIKPVLTN
jgi:hypothetical protein